MKFLTLGLIIVTFGYLVTGEPKNCLRPSFRREYKSWTDCRPREEMVPVKVPEDCDEVYPAMVSAPRCNGVCPGSNKKCRSTNSTTKMYIMECRKGGRLSSCTNVDIELHHSCNCSCALTKKDCRKENKVLQKKKCKCECSKELEKACNDMVTRENGLMFNRMTCNCDCPAGNCLSALTHSPQDRRRRGKKNKKVMNSVEGNQMQMNLV